MHVPTLYVSARVPAAPWVGMAISFGLATGVYVGLCDRYSICGNVSLDVPVAVYIRAQRV